MAFDPDKYLAKKSFDPDAYLANVSTEKPEGVELTNGEPSKLAEIAALREKAKAIDTTPYSKKPLGQYAFPEAYKLEQSKEFQNLPFGTKLGRGLLTRVSDLISAPRRVSGALTEAVKGEPVKGLEELLDTGEDAGMGTSIARSLPAVVAGPSTKFAQSLPFMGKVLTAAAPDIALGQMENLGKKGELSGEKAAATLALGALLPVGGKLAKGAGDMLRLPVAKATQGLGKTLGELKDRVPMLKTGELAPSPKTGIQLTPAAARGETEGFGKAIETFSQMDPSVSDIPGKIKATNIDAVEKTMDKLAERVGSGSLKARQQLGSYAGQNITGAAQDAKKAIGREFAEGQEQSIAKILDAKAPIGTIGNLAENSLESYIRKAGSEIGEVATMRGSVSPQAMGLVQNMHQEATQAKTVGELLNLKRNFAKKIYEPNSAGAFFKGKDKAFIEGAEREVNESIGKYFDVLLDADDAKATREIWNSINENYASNREILGLLDKKLGFAKDFKSDEVISKVAKLSDTHLQKLKNAASENPEMDELFQEIRKGSFEGLMKSSVGKGGDISFAKLQTAWDKIPAQNKRILFDSEFNSTMDTMVDQLARLDAIDLFKMNPSGTAATSYLGRLVQNPKLALQGLVMRPLIKKYYSTGEVPFDSFFPVLDMAGRTLEATGSAATSGIGIRAGLEGMNL